MAEPQNPKHPNMSSKPTPELEAELDALLSEVSAIEPDLKPSSVKAKEKANPKPPTPDAPPQPATEDAFESQLNSLLKSVVDEKATRQSEADQESDKEAPASDEDLPTGSFETVTQATEEDLAGDELANQIQSMLDEARRQRDAGQEERVEQSRTDDPVGAQPGSDAPTQGIEDSQDAAGESISVAELLQAVDSKSGDIEPAKATATLSSQAEPSAQVTTDSAQADDKTLGQIDQMLAEGADEAIAGDFETVSDVIDATTSHAGQEHSVTLDTSESYVQSGRASARRGVYEGQDLKESEEEIPEGDFETPEELLSVKTNGPAGATGQPDGASSDEVARELDEELAQARRSAVTEKVGDARRRNSSSAFAGLSPRRAALLTMCAFVGLTVTVYVLFLLIGRFVLVGRGYWPTLTWPAFCALVIGLCAARVWWVRLRLGGTFWSAGTMDLRRWCEVVNAPVLRLSPDIRNGLGYVALVNVFFASVLIIGKVVSMMMK
ncbi:MAG: hypothetical protein GC164_13610 [Phycisphaera sp.]|nr:hypothetical protein [Phycisphaera sp.]